LSKKQLATLLPVALTTLLVWTWFKTLSDFGSANAQQYHVIRMLAVKSNPNSGFQFFS